MKFNTIYVILYVSMLSSLVVAIVGLMKFNSIPSTLKLLTVLAGVSFLCDLGPLLTRAWKIQSNYIGNGYRLVEFGLLLAIYHLALKNPKLLKVLFALSIVYITFFVINVGFFQKASMNSYTNTLLAMIFIVLAIAYFYKLMNDLPTLKIHYLPMFWVNVAVLVYFSGSLFVFIVSDYLLTILHDNLTLYWGFHNLLNTLKNVLFTIGIYMGIKNTAVN